MACKSIITIGREFGSGGKEIGMKLADSLGKRQRHLSGII